MNKISIVRSLFFVLVLALLAGCGGGSASSPGTTPPLSADNINLIFVVSPDLDHPEYGDINQNTANLTNQGLQRSLLLGTYLKTQVLGTKNVTSIYALEPMTHLQTANNYPYIAAIGYIQQFALLNQITLRGAVGTPLIPASSYPINASYAVGAVPGGVAQPVPPCPDCQGLIFGDTGAYNVTLATNIIKANVPGFYVFSAPWKTISALMTDICKQKGYSMNLPTAYGGPNKVYAISIGPSGDAGLVTYDSNLAPLSTYPVLPGAVAGASCPGPTTIPALFSIPVTGGINGAVIPSGINTNQTIYMVRHAEAHPVTNWDDGNFLGAGQWRALFLPNALQTALLGKPKPTQLYSVDPAQVEPGAVAVPGNFNFSYVRPAMTVFPYAIANNMPLNLVADIEIFDPSLLNPNPNNNPYPAEIVNTVNFFFFNGRFSSQTVLLAWEHSHFPYILNALLASYYPNGGAPSVALNAWPETDYDTIWTVTIDAQGNLTVNNALCEGINSALLPVAAPQF